MAETHKLLPAEPTEAMIDAAMIAMDGMPSGDEITNAYRAMFGAAPETSGEADEIVKREPMVQILRKLGYTVIPPDDGTPNFSGFMVSSVPSTRPDGLEWRKADDETWLGEDLYFNGHCIGAVHQTHPDGNRGYSYAATFLDGTDAPFDDIEDGKKHISLLARQWLNIPEVG